MVERVSRRGKLFYSCSEYPGCTFASWKEPVNRECPECGSMIMLKRKLRKGGTVLQCMVRGCGGKLADDA
jgi:DNA topoisomerase-1